MADSLLDSIINWLLPRLFIWVIYSLVTMSLIEFLSIRFRWRENLLEDIIRYMLDLDLYKEFIKHPLILTLSSRSSAGKKENSTFNFPAYIPPNIFALVLLDILLQMGSKPKEEVKNKDLIRTYVPPNIFALALLDMLLQMGFKPKGEVKNKDLIRIKNGVNMIKSKSLRTGNILNILLENITEENCDPLSKEILANARRNIEDWFISAMAATSNLYRRRVRNLAMVVGIMVAVVINIDAFSVFAKYSYIDNASDKLSTLIDYPVGWAGLPNDGPAYCQGKTLSDDNVISAGKNCYVLINTPKMNDFTGWLLKISGLYTAGLILGTGAPLLYDLLKKKGLINLPN